jgi:AcrR family transcriptional regulator
MTKEEKIVAKALEMFNERGIEYVGLRELAAVLGIRVGNITYYFPTKDDLVNRLAQNLSNLNERISVEENLSLFSFLDRFRKVFANHVQYRCLLLSFVHLMEQNRVLSEGYKETEKKRYSAIVANLSALQAVGLPESGSGYGFSGVGFYPYCPFLDFGSQPIVSPPESAGPDHALCHAAG